MVLAGQALTTAASANEFSRLLIPDLNNWQSLREARNHQSNPVFSR